MELLVRLGGVEHGGGREGKKGENPGGRGEERRGKREDECELEQGLGGGM